MWVLVDQNDPDIKFYLVGGHEITLGRSKTDIIVLEGSISRSHACFSVKLIQEDTLLDTLSLPHISIKDRSKFGTFVNNKKIESGVFVPLSENAEIRFGVLRAFSLKWEPFLFSTSMLDKSRKHLIIPAIQAVGHLTEDVTSASYLLAGQLSSTDAVLLALCNHVPIIGYEWVVNVSRASAFNATLPSCSEFLPHRCNEWIKYEKSFFVSNSVDRTRIFQAAAFIFISCDQVSKWSKIVTLCGGSSYEWTDNSDSPLPNDVLQAIARGDALFFIAAQDRAIKVLSDREDALSKKGVTRLEEAKLDDSIIRGVPLTLLSAHQSLCSKESFHSTPASAGEECSREIDESVLGETELNKKVDSTEHQRTVAANDNDLSSRPTEGKTSPSLGSNPVTPSQPPAEDKRTAYGNSGSPTVVNCIVSRSYQTNCASVQKTRRENNVTPRTEIGRAVAECNVNSLAKSSRDGPTTRLERVIIKTEKLEDRSTTPLVKYRTAPGAIKRERGEDVMPFISSKSLIEESQYFMDPTSSVRVKTEVAGLDNTLIDQDRLARIAIVQSTTCGPINFKRFRKANVLRTPMKQKLTLSGEKGSVTPVSLYDSVKKSPNVISLSDRRKEIVTDERF